MSKKVSKNTTSEIDIVGNSHYSEEKKEFI